jgi:hypothetical protein
MCLLNEEFVNKISQNMAYNLVKEAFIDSVNVPTLKRFFTSGRKDPETVVETSILNRVKDIIDAKSFQYPDGCLDDLLLTNFSYELESNAPNVPRNARNADVFPTVRRQNPFDPEEVEQQPQAPMQPQRPLQTGNNDVNSVARKKYIEDFGNYQVVFAQYRPLYAAYMKRMDTIAEKCKYHQERHTDGRDLYQFHHRQSDDEVYDHEDSLICKEGIVEFLQFLSSANKKMSCFDDEMCDGYIHPLEVRDILTSIDERKVYAAYRGRFNRNPPQRNPPQGNDAQGNDAQEGGSKATESEEFAGLFFQDPTPLSHYQTCALPRQEKKGGKQKQKQGQGQKRKTRKRKLRSRKTRKANRYTKTRKH